MPDSVDWSDFWMTGQQLLEQESPSKEKLTDLAKQLKAVDDRYAKLRADNPGCIMLGHEVPGVADGHFYSRPGQVPTLSYHCPGCERVFSEPHPTTYIKEDGRCPSRPAKHPQVWEGDNS